MNGRRHAGVGGCHGGRGDANDGTVAFREARRGCGVPEANPRPLVRRPRS